MFAQTISEIGQWIINNIVYIAAFFLALSMITFLFSKDGRGAIYLALLAIGSMMLFSIMR